VSLVNELPGLPTPITVPLPLVGVAGAGSSSSALVITTMDLSQDALVQGLINADQRRTNDVRQTLPEVGVPPEATDALSPEALQRQMNQAVDVISGGPR